jgi:hypothetical protein
VHDLGDPNMQQELDGSLRGVEPAEEAGRPTGSVGTVEEPVEGAAIMSPPGSVEGTAPGTVPTFLNQIARQMLAAVETERSRISADTANSLDEHVRKVRIRAAKESEELRRLAEADVGEINEWSAGEADRVRRETETKITARREDLQRHLHQHDALIEREITGANDAVGKYQAELDQFVDRLAVEDDPTEIAQLARDLPEPPDIDEVASAARAEAIAELSESETEADVEAASLGMVGVMDKSVIRPRTGIDAGAQAVADTESVADAEPVTDTAAASEADPELARSSGRISPAVRWALVILIVAIVAGLLFLLATGRLAIAGF